MELAMESGQGSSGASTQSRIHRYRFDVDWEECFIHILRGLPIGIATSTMAGLLTIAESPLSAKVAMVVSLLLTVVGIPAVYMVKTATSKNPAQGFRGIALQAGIALRVFLAMLIVEDLSSKAINPAEISKDWSSIIVAAASAVAALLSVLLSGSEFAQILSPIMSAISAVLGGVSLKKVSGMMKFIMEFGKFLLPKKDGYYIILGGILITLVVFAGLTAVCAKQAMDEIELLPPSIDVLSLSVVASKKNVFISIEVEIEKVGNLPYSYIMNSSVIVARVPGNAKVASIPSNSKFEDPITHDKYEVSISLDPVVKDCKARTGLDASGGILCNPAVACQSKLCSRKKRSIAGSSATTSPSPTTTSTSTTSSSGPGTATATSAGCTTASTSTSTALSRSQATTQLRQTRRL